MVARGRGLAGATVALACIAAVGSPARADEAPSDIAAARALAIEGVLLADGHKCDEAIDRLTRAERLYHAPTTLGRLAECQLEMGRIVAGTENLQKLLREPLPPKPPAAFVFARARAQRALAAALPKIAKLRIVVNAPQPTRVSVTIDGEPVSSALYGVDRPTNPGEHVVEATAPGSVRLETTMTLAPGESRTLPITLPREGSDASGPIAPIAAPPPPAPLPRAAPSRTGAFVAFGLGAVGIGAAAVLGGLYLSRQSELGSPGSGVTEDEVSTLRSATGGVFVLGLSGIVVGIVLVAMGDGQPLATTALRPGQLRF